MKEQLMTTSENTHTFADNGNTSNSNSTSEQLITRERIDNTPFDVIGEKDNGYFVAMGMYALTERQETRELCLRQLHKNKWNIMLTIAHIVSEMLYENKSTQIK